MRPITLRQPEAATDAAANPFLSGDRGLRFASTPRLRELLRRHRGWLARIEAERGISPKPDTARLYCEAVVAEIEDELALRSEVAA